MVSIPLMTGLAIATFGLGHALSLRRRYGGLVWPNKQLTLLAVLAIIAGGLMYCGMR